MPTERGYVEKLGVGRAGLVEATVMHGDNSTAIYTIADLDADPERFNERLSKFGILRDAMDRAEPVEIQYVQGDDVGARAIESVMRLTRDVLERTLEGGVAEGIIIGIAADSQVVITSRREASDRVLLFLQTKTGPEAYYIPMQMPERDTAMAMVHIARDAQADGASVAVSYNSETRYITEIVRSDIAGWTGATEANDFSAFVEEITHTPVSNLMRVTVTTAPEFQSDGNVVPLENFTPEERVLAVIYNSPEYLLLEAALRDKLRVELLTLLQGGREPRDPDDTNETSDTTVGREISEDRLNVSRLSEHFSVSAATTIDGRKDVYMLRGATLQHALCSASRPVWIEVNRRALDVGPDAECLEGLPSNDMKPQSIRDLDLPYRAAWIGYGCFNHGVYRIQIVTDRDLTIIVDGDEICTHRNKKGDTIFGHACLDGDHEIRIVFENWQCKAKFDMDVYRIR